MVERGCGRRKAGGAYLETLLSPFGLPLEEFIVDPPWPIDPDAIGVSPIGVKLVQQNGVYHVLDWIGSEHYPNVADFVEETRLHGASRRIPAGFDAKLLTPESRLVLIHARGFVGGWEAYERPDDTFKPCPKGCHTELGGSGLLSSATDWHCARIWWDDVEGVSGTGSHDLDRRLGTRETPSARYCARRRPAGARPTYRPALILRLPIHQIAVVEDAVGRTHEQTLERLGQSSVPIVTVVE